MDKIISRNELKEIIDGLLKGIKVDITNIDEYIDWWINLRDNGQKRGVGITEEDN